MNYIEKSGKTVEEAVAAGLKELGKESSDVTIEVLQYGSPGLFGMFGKLAKVRLTVKEQKTDFDFEMPVFSLDQVSSRKPSRSAPKREEKKSEPPKEKPSPAPAPEKKAQPEKTSEPQAVEPAAAAQDEDRQDEAEQAVERAPRRRSRGSRGPRQRRSRAAQEGAVQGEESASESRRRVELEKPQEDLPPLDMEALSADGRNAYEFLKQLTHLMNVDVEIRIAETEGHMQVQMIGDTLGVLIGRRGDTLDALQYLTSLQVNKGREEYLRVTLDTEHYRAKREEALRRLAERMANRARRTGHRVTLEPMNPYERRVLHATLQDNAYVTTHSEGEEPYRRVVITLK